MMETRKEVWRMLKARKKREQICLVVCAHDEDQKGFAMHDGDQERVATHD